MELKTTKGEIVHVRQKEIIWNALDYLTHVGCNDDEIFIALQPRRPGVRVKREEFYKLVTSIRYKYA